MLDLREFAVGFLRGGFVVFTGDFCEKDVFVVVLLW
jgi:hypothetical protein